MVPNDDFFNSGQHDPQGLEPVNRDMVPSGPDDVGMDPVQDFFNNYQGLLGNALMFMLQQDSQNLRLVINRINALQNNARKYSNDESELILMLFVTRLVEIFEPMARAMRFHVEGRFKTAKKEFQNASDFCSAQIKELTGIGGKPDKDKAELIDYLKHVFALFEGWMTGYTKYCDAEMIGYTGHSRQYVTMLRDTVDYLRNVVDSIPPGSPDDLVSVGSLCGKMADQLESRAEAFENQASANRYIEPAGRNVFIIHGHDEARWRELRDLLQDEFHLDIVVLKEEPGSGRTIIKKFEDYAMDSCIAFAILTPDDFVDKGSVKYLQARPNVLFEMGWFFGRYGAAHLCIIKHSETSLPSDLAGISTIDYRDNITEKSLAIRNELRQAGLIP